jgi:hypothetical protein
VRLSKYYSGDQIKEDEVGGSCSTHGIDGKCYNILIGRGNSEDLGVGGKIMLKWILQHWAWLVLEWVTA